MIFYKINLFKNLKKVLILSLILFFLLVGCQNKKQNIEANYNTKAMINGKQIFVEIVTSVSDTQRGLSERDKMCGNCGMLFLMPEKSTQNFWMYKMKFPLDFAFISDGKIVEIYKNVPIYTNNEYTKINSTKNSDMILELNSGFFDKNNIKVGTEIQLIPPGQD